MIANGYYYYVEKCWLILDVDGNHVGHGEIKATAVKDFINWLETKKDISKEWRRFKRQGYQIVKANVTFEYEVPH